MNILFVCNKNLNRGLTAEIMFSEYRDVKTTSGGLSSSSLTRLDGQMVTWADVIMVMEQSHLARMKRRFGPQLTGKEVIVLGIADEFKFMGRDLVVLLQSRVEPRLATLG